jgi:putative membrane protein
MRASLALGLMITVGALAPAVASGQESQTPLELVARMHHANAMEMDAGKLAMKRGQTARLRRYGALLWRDHRLADRMLVSYAGDHGIAIVAPTPENADEAADMLAEMAATEDLQNAAGPEFDRLFLAMMIKDHEKLIAVLNGAEPAVSDGDLKGMLRKTIPILQQHLQLAKNLESSMATEGGTTWRR